MNYWIQVQSDVINHRKTFALADKLHITRHEALGLMVNLWIWASINAVDGDISGFTPRSIKEALGTKKSHTALFQALLDTGLVEKTEQGRVVIHNWEKYAKLLMAMDYNRKEKIKQRVKRHREKMKGSGAEPLCNSSTVPNRTEPNQTNPPLYLSEERTPLPPQNSLLPGGGDGGDFRLIAEYLSKRQLNLADYLGAGAVLEEVDRYTKSAMMLWNRPPAPLDNVRVFLHGTTWDGDNRQVDRDKMDLLFYAMEQALNAGKAGNWNYVEGVLTNLYQRDIQTVAQAEDYIP